jgi:hypothetical protein
MQQALVRVALWYVAFSLIVGGVLYALAPGFVPIYLVIAVIGAWGILAAARDKLRSYAASSLVEDWMQRHAAEPERTSADVVEDLQRRRSNASGIRAEHPEVAPNPYFVLPVPELIARGFATAVEVREAGRWANSPTPPVRWQNPQLRELLNSMGWSDREAYARIGLFFWHMDNPARTDPQSARIEASLRAEGHLYDVPRPASLD